MPPWDELMPAHQRVRTWIAQNYQRPAIDQEWLSDCSDWLTSELGLDPTRDFDQFVQHVEAQLLQSNLADSTVPGSGIDPLLVAPNPGRAPHRPSSAPRPRQNRTTGATPLLVEIRSITEIAHSALSLLNTHQTRLDRADLGLAQEDNGEQHPDEDEGPVPRFPRGMLKFELSDGLTSFRAIEFKSLPQLELGATPLGYKLFLKSTPIRSGIAFLEPSNVILKGYRTEDHDVNREQVFLSLLRKRLGRPDPPPEVPVAGPPRVNPPEPPPVQPGPQRQPPPVVRSPSPPPDLDDMYVDDDDVDPDVLREMAIQIDEATNLQEQQRVGIRAPMPARPPPKSKEKSAAGSDPRQALCTNTPIESPSVRTPSDASSVKTSPYFTACSSDSKPIPDIDLSPRPVLPSDMQPDFDITWDVDDPEPSRPPTKKVGFAPEKRPPTAPTKHGLPPKQPSSPDSYDDLSFDMEVDDSFLEQVGMIEQGALATGSDDKGKGKGKDKDTRSGGRLNVTPAKNTSSGSILGTKLSAHYPVSPSSAEPSTRMPSSTKRATTASSLSDSTESPMPQSTQSSDRRLHHARDPSFIIISSSEDEATGVDGAARTLDPARRRTNKEQEVGKDEIVDTDVIDISD